MTIRERPMGSALAVSTAASCLVAAASVAQPAGITEAEFLARVAQDHPAAVVLQERLIEATGELQSSRVENLSVGVEREAPEGAAAQTTAVLSWRPPFDGRRGLAKRAAEAGMEAARHSLSWDRLQFHAHLRELFAEWSLVAERRDLFEGLSARTERLADRASARAASGEESGLNARRLELAFIDTAGQLAAAEAELTRLVTRLRTLIPDLDHGLKPTRPALPEMPATLDAQKRPDVLASERELERAELEHRLANRFLEFPALIAGWTYLDEETTNLDGPGLRSRMVHSAVRSESGSARTLEAQGTRGPVPARAGAKVRGGGTRGCPQGLRRTASRCHDRFRRNGRSRNSGAIGNRRIRGRRVHSYGPIGYLPRRRRQPAGRC